MHDETERLSVDDLVFKPIDQVNERSLQCFEVPRDSNPFFRQGYDELERWLGAGQGLAAHIDRQVRTVVAVRGDDAVGFIATHAFEIDTRHQGMKDAQYVKPYSGLKVRHLAVRRDFAGRGVGELLLYTQGIGVAALLSRLTGCRFVYLDALRPAVPFYRKHLFLEIPTKAGSGAASVPMVFDLLKAGAALDEYADAAAAVLVSAR